MSKQADFIIVGAGILGLTCARELLRRRPRARVLVLEKEGELGRHASGRNSGVLHSGIYYPADTLKAKAACEGAAALAAYCEERGLAIKRVGKLVLASDATQTTSLHTYMQRAKALGLDARWLEGREINSVEPAAAGIRALHLPNVAVIDAKAVLAQLADEVRGLGGTLRLGCCVLGADAGRSRLHTGDGGISFGFLINTAGAHVDTLARHFGVDKRYLLLPFLGRYYRLDPASGIEVRGLIYPVPDARLPFLGIHFTRTVDDRVYVGPSAMPVLGREHYRLWHGIDWAELPLRLGLLAKLYAQNRQGFRLLARRELGCLAKSRFAAEAAKLVPQLAPAHLLAAAKSGIRPQLFDRKSGEMVMDFRIERRGNSLHILNAISPALTCSFAIARLVAERIE